MHSRSAVNTEDLARNIARLRRTQEANCRRNFLSAAKTSHRRVIKQEFALLLCESGGEFCRNEARCNGISRNTTACHRTCSAQRQSNNASICSAIVCLARRSSNACHSRDLDDASPACSHPSTQRGPGAKKSR